ncbi:MAG: hypothetical protein K2M36_02095 [Clostridia bacterium]|nr:hypothetical protein [Clostridia bacterium]
MNLKDFTLKLEYSAEGKTFVKTLDSAEIASGYSDGAIALSSEGDSNKMRVVLNSANIIELISAELIYDRYYAPNEHFFANGFQSWTTSREYKHNDVQNGLSAICKIPYIKQYAGASGDYYFAKYGKNLFHSFTYTYLRNADRVSVVGSLNERTGYTVFYADMQENLLIISKDVEGARVQGEYELFNVICTRGSYDQAFDAYFAAYPRKHTGRVDHFAGYTSW